MPRLSRTVPRYRKHRASGQALVVLSGQGFYLGPYGTKASKIEYDRLIAEWLARGRRPVTDPTVVCESAPDSVRQARQLIEFMRERNYMPRLGKPAMRCVYEVVKVLSEYAKDMRKVIEDDLVAAQRELQDLRVIDWKNIDISKPPKTPQDFKSDDPSFGSDISWVALTP